MELCAKGFRCQVSGFRNGLCISDLERPLVRPRPRTRPRRRCVSLVFEDDDKDDFSSFDFAII